MTKSKMNQNSAIGNANSALLETIFDFLAANSMYPVISRKGKIYFKCSRKVQLAQGKAEELIAQLEIKTEEDCKRIRNEVKKRAAASRENRPINKWIKEERPREMLTKYGPESLPLSKLLAIILRIGKEGTSAEELSKRLLNKFGGLREIDSAPISEICKIEGIGPAKAAQIRAALEIGKRFFKESAQKQKRIKKPDDVIDYVAEYYGPYLRDAKKEFFHVILLDIKNKPMHNIEISKGIGGIFYDMGWIEQWGSGIDKMRNTCTKAGLPEPQFEECQGFRVIFRKDIYTEEYLRDLGLNERQMKAVMYVKEKGKITNKLKNIKRLLVSKSVLQRLS